MKGKLIIPLSYFNGQPYSELIELDLSNGERSLLLRYAPARDRQVTGKGFTQIVNAKEHGVLIVADYNQVHLIDIVSYEIVKSIVADNLNDIHSIAVMDDKILIANTGYDSIEIYSIAGEFITSINLLTSSEIDTRLRGSNVVGDSYYDDDLSKPFFQRKVKDKFHINNITCIGNELVLTLFEKRTLLLSPFMSELASPISHHIHDSLVYDNRIWITSVTGKIYSRERSISKKIDFEEYVDLFSLGNYYGWCRGIAINNGLMYIGITQINYDIPKSKWDVQVDVDDTRTGIIKLDMNTKRIVDFYDFTDDNISRIFGFLIL